MSKIIASTSSVVSATRSALTTQPSLRGWLETLLVLAAFLCIAGYIGFVSGLFKVELTDTWTQFAIIALVAFAIPSLAEELVFRVGLPHLLGARWWSDALALALFVLWHPLQVWLGLPMGKDLFLLPEFLAIVGLLGASCTLLRHRTGSVWPSVVIHWVTVLVWKGLTIPA